MHLAPQVTLALLPDSDLLRFERLDGLLYGRVRGFTSKQREGFFLPAVGKQNAGPVDRGGDTGVTPLLLEPCLLASGRQLPLPG